MSKTSREYERAGGDNMTREEAVRHFANRALKIKREILSLSLPDRVRLLADFLEAGDAIDKKLVHSLAGLVVSELERLP